MTKVAKRLAKKARISKLSDSIQAKNELNDNSIDLFGGKLIHTLNSGLKLDAFAYCFSFMQFYLQPNKVFIPKTQILDASARPNLDSCLYHLKHIDFKTNYALMVPLNTDLNGGYHWFLATIFFPLKRIVLFDSQYTGDKDYREYFLMLFHLVEMIAFKEEKKTSLYDWKFMVASTAELPQQTNGYDCGVFTCLYMYSIMGNDLQFANSLNNEEKRQFVRDTLDNYPLPSRSSRSPSETNRQPTISLGIQLKNIHFTVSSSATVVNMFHEFLRNDKCVKCKKGFEKNRNIYRCIFCNYTMHVVCIKNFELKCLCN